jgi:YdjC-like protein
MGGTLAERLGFGAGERVAVVHVDDLGMCHAANEGGFEALESGPASCGSIMVPCPWFREAADRARANPGLDLGVHLTLNAEWSHYRWGPVAGRAAVPSLVDAEGYLPRTTAETVQRAKPEEVEIELRAQIEMALAAGVDVTHLDSHMGTVLFPPFLSIYARLARDYRLPVFAFRPDDAVLEARGLRGYGPVIRPVIDALEADGIPVLDDFDADSLDFPAGQGLVHNRRRLAGLRPGVSYLICHAAMGGEELSAVTPDSAHQRDFERSFYGGEAGRKELEAGGIRSVGMRALRDLVRGSGDRPRPR